MATEHDGAVGAGGRRVSGSWALGVSGLGWSLGIVGVLVPTLSADLLADPNPAIAVLAGGGMLVANVVSLVIAVVGLRRALQQGRGLLVAGLVLSILGVLGGLGVVVFGGFLLFAWAIGNAAAVGL
jgi:vacuolar-type H+-ATPase subunit I/STV1